MYTDEQKELLYQRLEDAFATYKDVDAFRVTSDFQLFAQLENAEAHAQRLKARQIATVSREQFKNDIAPPSMQVVTGDESLLHPEASTQLTPDELAANAAANTVATAEVDEAIKDAAKGKDNK